MHRSVYMIERKHSKPFLRSVCDGRVTGHPLHDDGREIIMSCLHYLDKNISVRHLRGIIIYIPPLALPVVPDE